MNAITTGSIVVWSQRKANGNTITFTKHGGKVLSIDGDIATIQRKGNNRRLQIHISRLTAKQDDTPLSLVEQAKRELGVQEPPSDYRVFNRRQSDGSFRPLSEFFKTD